jgi:hypothetical protein
LLSLFSALLFPAEFKRKECYNVFMTQHSLTTLSNTSATRLTPNGTHSGLDITIQNVDASAIVYIGGIGVTSTDYGYRLSPGAAWSVELPSFDSMYAITNTNNSEVAVLTTGLE